MGRSRKHKRGSGCVTNLARKCFKCKISEYEATKITGCGVFAIPTSNLPQHHLWLQLLQIPEDAARSYASRKYTGRLSFCARHFEDSQFVAFFRGEKYCVRLKPGAIPSSGFHEKEAGWIQMLWKSQCSTASDDEFIQKVSLPYGSMLISESSEPSGSQPSSLLSSRSEPSSQNIAPKQRPLVSRNDPSSSESSQSPPGKTRKITGSTGRSVGAVACHTATSESSEARDRSVRDPDYAPSSDHGTSELDLSEEDMSDLAVDPRFLFPISMIQQMVTVGTVCVHDGCVAKMDPKSFRCQKLKTGSEIKCYVSCLNSLDGPHVREYSNSPSDGSLNTEVCVAITHSGASFTDIQRLGLCLQMPLPSKSTYHKRDAMAAGIIAEEWAQEQEKLIAEVIELHSAEYSQNRGILGEIGLNCDCRHDTVGHSATFGTHSFQEQKTGKIICIDTVKKSDPEVDYHSPIMEFTLFKRNFPILLAALNTEKTKVTSLCSDMHSAIKRHMKTYYGHMNHRFDPFHVKKSKVTKPIGKLVSLVKHAVLLPWVNKIAVHFSECVIMARGDPVVVEETWRSLLYHIQGIHEWEDDPHFTTIKRCAHEHRDPHTDPISYLDPGSETFKQLSEIVLNKYLLDALAHLSHAEDTSSLESFHALLLVWMSKERFLQFEPMKMRSQIAAFHHNLNVHREIIPDRYHRKFVRQTKKEIVVEAKRPTDWTWLRDHTKTVADQISIKIALEGSVRKANQIAPKKHGNLASIVPPHLKRPKDVLIAERQSRKRKAALMQHDIELN